ncbi:Dyp-type peroxidase [Pseudogemmobacter humi]|uniref:Putative deferrochelatase/peroxidase YfeX n=1 Tax=Pseudogemmobacter humi TaxID=2483812 RepID=A0A3P5XG82_9RHOB|nr:Dyp-type peroxidase [Pseudogemmobacter humi]VDC33775.1 putative deferrochelatase/peroxidase YfeX [Pseudogemmobacter humi]
MQPAISQPVDGPLTRSAIFVTLTLAEGDDALASLRGLLGDLPSLVKAVGFRSSEAGLTCVVGIGANLWSRMAPGAVPQGLHPFREIAGIHHAPATAGDLLFHIRAARSDFCFELVSRIMRRLAAVTSVEDETQGFKYFDNRDLLGFVDGTENPLGRDLTEAVMIGDEDPVFAGGSYVITQKYIHDMAQWEAMPVEQQERVIGRQKLSDVELADGEKASYAHNVLTNIEDESGRQLEILRDNMPFGSPAKGEFGTFFIGYAREPGRMETMLRNMFIGKPPGNYDRILDVSAAVTGCLFFVPSADMLDVIARGGKLVLPEAAPEPEPDRSLGLGSLKQGN